MPDHTHLKWLNKFITSMDPKNQLHRSSHFPDEAESLFGMTMGMPNHTHLKWLMPNDAMMPKDA